MVAAGPRVGLESDWDLLVGTEVPSFSECEMSCKLHFVDVMAGLG